ncbi:aldehyde dehydrogenase family protein [Haliea sp. E17]|uniref:aldehyde dehydrogenase family protein n=1 Tax=Haliea sp. E17 TaxID=3401576 RepID=UPI003AAC3A3B
MRNQNRIDGAWCDSRSGRDFVISNPADLRDVVHRYPLSSSRDVLKAVESAARAQARWRKVPVAEKALIMREAGRLVHAHREQIARLITRENGKLFSESLTEIDSTIAELEFQVGEGERQFGRANQSHKGSAWGITRLQPIGVVSVIIPWNFPFNVPFRKLIPALMAGNTAVLKPASQTAGVGELVVHILTEAGLPSDVLQFVTGSGGELCKSLVACGPVRAVTFTGSTSVGRSIAQAAAPGFVRTQLEMGGKNPVIALADADLELVAEQVVVGAYSCAGQWCTATSRLIVEERIRDALLEKILERVRNIVPGPGVDAAATMGPVCGETQLASVLRHIDTANQQGARLLLGGGRIMDDLLQHGCFVAPTIFELDSPGLDLAREEVFGPVLAIETAKDYSHAVALANDVPYGLSSSVFTADLDRAFDFAEQIESGVTHINMHSAYKEPQFSFGGIKESGFGLPEAGSSGIQFFQDEKTVYVKR